MHDELKTELKNIETNYNGKNFQAIVNKSGNAAFLLDFLNYA